MLKELRLKNGLKQKELADKIGVNVSTLSLYEGGKRQPPLNKISALAKALNVEESDVLKCFHNN